MAAITHPYSNVNSDLIKPQLLRLRGEWVLHLPFYLEEISYRRFNPDIGLANLYK